MSHPPELHSDEWRHPAIKASCKLQVFVEARVRYPDELFKKSLQTLSASLFKASHRRYHRGGGIHPLSP